MAQFTNEKQAATLTQFQISKEIIKRYHGSNRNFKQFLWSFRFLFHCFEQSYLIYALQICTESTF